MLRRPPRSTRTDTSFPTLRSSDLIRQDGKSICIAPEGTRTLTPKLGPFKKGAFHLAMQAGVPIVPIAIHNAKIGRAHVELQSPMRISYAGFCLKKKKQHTRTNHHYCATQHYITEIDTQLRR